MRDGVIGFMGLMLWGVGDLDPKSGPFWIILGSTFVVSSLADKYAEKQEAKKLKAATSAIDGPS